MTLLAWTPWALAVVVTGWAAAVLTAPVLPAWPAAFVYGLSSLVCHQLPERSFHWGAAQLAVCARCTGIYVGAALATMAASAVTPTRLMRLRPHVREMLFAGAVPTIVTVVAEWAGVWTPSHAARLAAGLPLGASVLATVAAASFVALRCTDTLHYDGCLPRPDASHPPRRP